MTSLRHVITSNPRMGSALLFSILAHAAVLFLFSLATWHVRKAAPSELSNPLLARIVAPRTIDDRDTPEGRSRQPVTSPASEDRPGAVITRSAPEGEVPVVEQVISQSMPEKAEQETGKTEPGPPFGVEVAETLFLRPLPRRFTDSNPLLEGQSFIRDTDLDDRPQPLVLAYPEYPPSALAKRLEGWVTIAFFLDEKGQVVHAWPVEASEDFQPYEFDLMQVVRQSTFTPGTLKGKPVKSLTFQTLRFNPQGWPQQLQNPAAPPDEGPN
jgi:outer membrane biosynthesis protein TonB